MNPKRLVTPLLFLLFAALGALQGAHVQHLREAEAFYRWLMAAGTNQRLFEEAGKDCAESEYLDCELYREAAHAAAGSLPAEALELAPNDPPEALAITLGELKYDKQIWNLARGGALAEQRQAFLEHARQRKLQYTTNIEYAEAQSSGVNIFNLFLGFRKVAANFLWIQVDSMWHAGHLHRMIPLMQTVFTLDPNFVDAYLLGAWHLAYNQTAKLDDTPPAEMKWRPEYQVCLGEKEAWYYEGIEILKNGIRKNPRDYRLYFDLGFSIYKNKLEDYENAVKYLREAVRQPHDRWVPRQYFICLELNGQYEEALAGWQDYAERFAGTTTAIDVAPRFIKRNRGRILEQRWEAALAEAKQAEDPVEAQRLRTEAERYKQEALGIWRTMNSPFAESRLMYMQARELVNQERYFEAVALLDTARYKSSEFFWEGSNLIIEVKQEGDIPLTQSEVMAVLRRSGGERCEGMPEGADPGPILKKYY